MKDRFFRLLDQIYNWIYRVVLWGTYTYLTAPKCRSLPGLAREEKQLLNSYWQEHFGRKISLKEYKWYKAVLPDQKTDPRNIPEVFWHSVVEPHFTNLQMLPGFADKNYFDSIIGQENSPKTICRCIEGQLLLGDFTAPDIETVCNELRSRDEVICKPSLDSGGGRGIMFLTKDEISETKLRALADKYQGNFIIQEILKQHPSMSRFNPDSLNTTRIISLLYKGEVHILASYLRVGVTGSKVDNLSAGGWMLPIKNGAFTGRVLQINIKKQHLEDCGGKCNGAPVDNLPVEHWDRMVAVVKKMHYKLAHFRLIYWDVVLSEEGIPIIVEYNLIDADAFYAQYATGPILGDMTEDILAKIGKRNWRKKGEINPDSRK